MSGWGARGTQGLKVLAERTRSRHLFVVDLIGMTAAALLAMALLLDGQVPGSYFWVVGIAVASGVVANTALGLYRHSWRHASVMDMVRIIRCTIMGGLLAAVIVSAVDALIPPGPGAPGAPGAAFWILDWALVLVALATPRFAIRAASDIITARSGSDRKLLRTLLYGAGWAGVIMVRSAERSPESGVIPVGFLDDDLDLKGRRVAGLHVFGGTNAIARAVRRTQASQILITMPRASGETIRQIVEAARALGVEVRTVPPVTDLLDGSIDATQIRRVRVEDLLRRPLARDHAPAVDQLIRGRTVMITGAAGSIGSELVRQVIAVRPAHVVMVDCAESALYMCELDAKSRSARFGEETVTVSTHLLDVTDRAAMAHLMQETKPSVVFHAAAYKHVPMLEEHPAKAVEVNIGGTLSMVDAAEAAGVEHFVLVSTDKAVWPSSVMGASKRTAELIVADAARRTGHAYIAVRFGNVLGSNGSVIPIFQEQLERGLPITITDPAMTRYFMTIPEAAWLILDAAAIADQGGLFVLDMGDPVRIMDIAIDLIRLSGRDPASVPIKVIGLRQGEKLHEELFYDAEQAEATEVPKVLRTRAPDPSRSVRDEAVELLAAARHDTGVQLKTRLHAYVRASVAADEERWLSGVEGLAGDAPLPGYRPVVAVPVASHTNGNGNGEHHENSFVSQSDGARSEPGEASSLPTADRRS